MNSKRFAPVLVALALAASACGGSDDSTPAATAAPVEAAAAGIQLANGPLGDFLADADGNTLYSFVPDAQGDSTCYDDCEAAWPVFAEQSAVGDGLDASLRGTTTRTDGSTQATENGWPLYYFAADTAAGDTNGQGAKDVWFVVDAAGNAISG